MSAPRLLAALLAAAAPVAVAPAHHQIIVDAGRGPITVYLPDSYDPGTPLPVILLLHGYTANGASMEFWLGLLDVIDEKEFIYAHPNGTLNPQGFSFWNATDACCNFFGSSVDDSQYLTGLLDEIELQLSVDPRSVHIAGHSNGGFMAYRMACDHADRIASIASIAGATFNDPAACTPSQPVHVLQIHGTLDGVIPYAGGFGGGQPFPSAAGSVEQWAGFAGCSTTGVNQPVPRDYAAEITGSETVVTVYDSGCEPGGSGELWTINGVGHEPDFNLEFTADLIDWLLMHPKTPAPLSYCTAGTSAAGCTALLQTSGTPSLSHGSGFVVSASGVEGAKDGLFFYGFAGGQQNAWGSGTSFQCVTPPVQRAGVLGAQGTVGACDGAFAQDFNSYWSSAPASKLPAPGSKLWLQLWYRDPQSTSNQTTSLSNALEISVDV